MRKSELFKSFTRSLEFIAALGLIARQRRTRRDESPDLSGTFLTERIFQVDRRAALMLSEVLSLGRQVVPRGLQD